MKKRTDLLDCMSGRIESSAFEELQADVKKTLQMMQKYYELYDLENGDMHGQIFKTLYIDGDYSEYDEVARRYHLHIYTLDRYRQRYNKLAKSC